MRLTRRQKITIAVLAAYWVAILILAHVPIPQLVYRAQVSDKWLHVLAYLVLAFLLWFSVSPDRKVDWRRGLVWLVFLVTVAYGGVDELVQPYVGRTKDFGDFLANVAGAAAALVIFTFLAFWQALLAVSAITIFGLTNLARANLSKLVPVADAVFHVLAYGGFTLCWIQLMNLYPPHSGEVSLKADPPAKTITRRLLSALLVPTGFLLAVKAASLLLGRQFAMTDLLFAVLGILGAGGTWYLAGFIRRTRDRAPQPAQSG